MYLIRLIPQKECIIFIHIIKAIKIVLEISIQDFVLLLKMWLTI